GNQAGLPARCRHDGAGTALALVPAHQLGPGQRSGQGGGRLETRTQLGAVLRAVAGARHRPGCRRPLARCARRGGAADVAGHAALGAAGMSAVRQVASWRELALGPGGRSLVEASAGTGKTWTIGVLWLRLLLEPEEDLGVERIVVTTFTEAAAQELRERLRRRLRDALALAAGNVPETPDEGETWLLSRWQDEACKAQGLRRLRLALADFDRAPIGTLHGLCQRILGEHPLESGQAFEPGEPASGRALLEELARDAWRVLRQGDDTPLHEAGLQDIGLKEFTRVLGELLRPGVRVIAPEETLEEVRLALAPSLAGPLREVVAQAEWFTRRNAVLRTSLDELGQWLETGVWPNDSKTSTQAKM